MKRFGSSILALSLLVSNVEILWAESCYRAENSSSCSTLSPEISLPAELFKDVYERGFGSSGEDGFIEFFSTTEIDELSFSRGRGVAVIAPAQTMSLEEILEYLEEHPYDHSMMSYLDSFVKKMGQEGINEVIKRFKEKPSSVALGVLVGTKNAHYEGIHEAFREVTQKIGVSKLLELWQEHPLPKIKAMMQPQLYTGQKELGRIFWHNRDRHASLGEISIGRLPIPGDKLADAQKRKYAQVALMKKDGKGHDISTGTALRRVSPEETLKRIDTLPLTGVLQDMVGFGFNQTYSLAVPWSAELKVSNGRNRYIIRGEMGSSGKGFTKEAATASALMEMIERYSSVAGSTRDFPGGYVEDKTMTRARYSDFTRKGAYALDPNALNVSYPYNDEELFWVKGKEKTEAGEEKEIWVPAQLVFLETNFDEIILSHSSLGSNGLASGNVMEEARLHALLEVIERDGDYTVFYSGEKCFSLDVKEEEHHLGKVIALAGRRGIAIQFLDLTSEFGIPTYRAFVKMGDRVISGSGTHLDGRIALARALGELNPKLWVYARQNGGLENISRSTDSSRVLKYADIPNYSTGTIDADLRLTEEVLLKSGFKPIYVDLTRKDLNVPVVRAIVPGLDIPDGISERQVLHLVQELMKTFVVTAAEVKGSPAEVFPGPVCVEQAI